MKVEDGCLAQVIAAIEPAIERSMDTFLGPEYFIFGYPRVAETNMITSTPHIWKKLWSESVQITGAKYNLPT